MKSLEKSPNIRTKIAVLSAAAAFMLAGAGCGKKEESDSQTTPPAATVPATVNQPLQCSDKNYTAEQNEAIRIRLDDGFKLDVINAGIVQDITTPEEGDRSHLFTAVLSDLQTGQTDARIAHFGKDVNFGFHYPAIGKTVTMFRVEAGPVAESTQKATFNVCSRDPDDMHITWEHVRDNAFSVIQPPTTPAVQQPPVNNSSI